MNSGSFCQGRQETLICGSLNRKGSRFSWDGCKKGRGGCDARETCSCVRCADRLGDVMMPPEIPDHELLRLIGRGAYGEVWLARNVMGVMRAVKVVRRSSFESHRPFEREFAAVKRYEPVSRAAAGLVNVLHAGRADAGELFYYVMELADAAVAGTDATTEPGRYEPCTLRTMIGRMGRLPVSDCLEIAVSLTHGVAGLHRTGLVHRDVKPSNIIFVSGRAKLADIGLVGDISESRSYVGTEGYVPPEGPGQPGADLYGLGRVLYEMVTGYEATRFPALPADWAQRGDAGAFEFFEIVLRCCEPDSARRYQTADELLADLALLQSGQSVRQVRQMRGRIAFLKRAAVVAAGMGLLAGVVAWWQSREADAQRQLVQRAEKAEAEARRNLFDGLVQQARNVRLSGAVDGRFTALTLLEKAAALHPGDAALREEFIAALATPGLLRTSAHRHEGKMVIFDAALTARLSVDSAQKTLRLCRMPGGEVLREWSPENLTGLIPVYVGENADTCAITDSTGRLRRWQHGNPLPDIEADGTGEVYWNLTPDGARAVAWRNDGTVTVLDLAQPANRLSWKQEAGYRQWVDHGSKLSSDGSLVVLGQHAASVVSVYALPEGKLLHRLASPRPLTGATAISGRGDVVASGMMDGGIAIWRTDGTAACEIIEGGNGFVNAMGMSGDGRFLVSFTWSAVTKVWDLADGTLIGRLPIPAGSARFSPDAKQLLTDTAGECARYECAAGVCEPLVLPRTQIHTPDASEMVTSFALHPQEPFLLYLQDTGIVLADAASLREVSRWPVQATAAKISGNGRWLFIAGRHFSRLALEKSGDGTWSAGLPEILYKGSEQHRFVTAAATPAGDLSAALCNGQTIHLYRDRAEAGKIQRPTVGTDLFSLHPGGKLLADTVREGPVRLRRIPGGEEAGSWPITGEWPVHAFSPDGKLLVWTDARGIHAIHPDSGEPAWSSPIAANGALGTFFQFDPTSRWLLISDEPGVVRLVDTSTGQPAVTLRRGREITSRYMAMDTSGAFLLELDPNTQTIWRWDLHTLRTHLRTRSLDWSSDSLPPPVPAAAPALRGILLNLPSLLK
jgi:Protein kinase domain